MALCSVNQHKNYGHIKVYLIKSIFNDQCT